MTGNGVDTNSGAASENRDDGGDGDTGAGQRPSLATYVRDAAERGESEERVVERVRASYEFDIPPRRVKHLVEAEREHLETAETEFVVAEHASRYADLDDLASLTDAEFGRVVSHLLGERDGHSEIASAPDSAGSPDDGADTVVEAGDDRVDGTEIRWHRTERTVLVRAVAAEPDRVVNGKFVHRVRETARAVHAMPAAKSSDTGSGKHDSEHTNSGSGSESGENEGHESADTAVVTVADVVPGAARLAVRSGIEIYDRTDVRRWLDEARLGAETFGSLIDGP